MHQSNSTRLFESSLPRFLSHIVPVKHSSLHPFAPLIFCARRGSGGHDPHQLRHSSTCALMTGPAARAPHTGSSAGRPGAFTASFAGPVTCPFSEQYRLARENCPADGVRRRPGSYHAEQESPGQTLSCPGCQGPRHSGRDSICQKLRADARQFSYNRPQRSPLQMSREFA